MEVNQGVNAIQQWYARQCDGDWEHASGIRIESTDNPGWQATIQLPPMPEGAVTAAQVSLGRRFGAQMIVDGSQVRLFATTLPPLLLATAELLGISDRQVAA